jgi:hypothetical protein
MTSRPRTVALLVIVLWFLGLCEAFAQQHSNQQIPDAPSATKPSSQLPSAPEPQTPPATNGPGEEQTPPPPIPPNAPPPSSAYPPEEDRTEAPTPASVSTVPSSAAPRDQSGNQESLYKIVTNVNQVIVPVRVTDESGLMVSGLLYKDFSVYEDGKKQNLNFFTSDPFRLSTAVVIDLGMPDASLQKVNQTFPALVAAFSQFD